MVLANDLLCFSSIKSPILQRLLDEKRHRRYFTFILINGILLCSISKIGCQIVGIYYNKCVATFLQQKISKS